MASQNKTEKFGPMFDTTTTILWLSQLYGNQARMQREGTRHADTVFQENTAKCVQLRGTVFTCWVVQVKKKNYRQPAGRYKKYMLDFFCNLIDRFHAWENQK